MADEDKTTEAVEPTEQVDTSTNDELQDTDVSLESDDTSFDDVDDDDTEEAEDLGESELDDSEEESDQDTEPAEPEEDSKEDEEQEESSEEESSDSTTDEDVKKHNQEMAARRIAEKQARAQAKAQQQAEYLEAAEDETQLAVRQLQIDAYNNLIEKNTSKLENDMEKAVASIDLLNDKTVSPEVREELLRRVDSFEAEHVKYDKNGDPVAVQGSLYEYLQNEADSIRRILNTGARNQVKAKEKQKSRTETLPSRAPKEAKVDPDLAAFDEEVAKWE